MKITVEQARAQDARTVAKLVGALLEEIITSIGARVFDIDLEDMASWAEDFLRRGVYFVFLARESEHNQAIGCITLYESHALYSGGVYGTIPELYVEPAYRSAGVGRQLLEQVKVFGIARGWKRLEVTTPPLPDFERTLHFYERHGFSITGGRKLKVDLD